MPRPTTFALSLRVGLLGAAFAVSTLGSMRRVDAAEPWRKESGTAHGSQVASSEWLPISIGAAAGLVVGGLAGSFADPSTPATIGPIAGGVIGAFTGGAAGAWLIRGAREQDTRLAGTLTGLGLGAGIGAVLLARTEPEGRALETVGKWSAIVLAPALGALAGHRLAVVWGSTATKEAPVPPPPVAFVRPNVAPVFGPNGSTGFSLGVDGAF
jgi:hypothetical protein